MSRYFLMGPALPVTISQSKQAPVQALVGRAYLMVGVTLMTSLYDSTMHLHCLQTFLKAFPTCDVTDLSTSVPCLLIGKPISFNILQYPRYSFFPRVIHVWNRLPVSAVTVDTTRSFITAATMAPPSALGTL